MNPQVSMNPAMGYQQQGRMSIASQGTPRGSQQSLSSQQLSFVPGVAGVDTMV